MHKTITLKNGIKVKIFSDNQDCTLHVYDASTDYDSDFTDLTIINYSEVKGEYLKGLAFYRYDNNFCPEEYQKLFN